MDTAQGRLSRPMPVAAQFLMRNRGFRDDVRGCLLLGLRHGGYCVGCCWVLMALLFVGGVMNVLWMRFWHCLSFWRNLRRSDDGSRVLPALPVWPRALG
jgi:predicted metal-binding membrane protein